jgi:threonine synthase
VFIPADLEQGKVIGTQVFGTNLVAVQGSYDDVNRLCTEISDKHRWAFVNINIRPFYAEGSKTFGYEIAEQLGWRVPKHIVIPMAGGSLITKIGKSFSELETVGLVESGASKLYGAQARGCSPIVTAVKEGADLFKPVRPKTIAKSLAIGNPADGFYAIEAMRRSGGWGEEVSNEEIVDAIKLLSETEGIFTETAGGVTVGVAKKLIEQGRIPRNESIVISITGNGLKTQEVLFGNVREHAVIDAKLSSFESLLTGKEARV